MEWSQKVGISQNLLRSTISKHKGKERADNKEELETLERSLNNIEILKLKALRSQ